jgi:hypothetical protein
MGKEGADFSVIGGHGDNSIYLITFLTKIQNIKIWQTFIQFEHFQSIANGGYTNSLERMKSSR